MQRIALVTGGTRGFHACHHGVLKVADELGPVDILVNNAGVTAAPPCTKSHPSGGGTPRVKTVQ